MILNVCCSLQYSLNDTLNLGDVIRISDLSEICALSIFKERWLPSVIYRYLCSYRPVHLVKGSSLFTEFNISSFAHSTIRPHFETFLSSPHLYPLFLEDAFCINFLLSAPRSSSWCLSLRHFCRSYGLLSN